MSNTIKKGLDYFPLDVNIYNDIKIRKLIKYQGGQSMAVYTYLLCNIFSNGYYIRWDDELPFVISEKTGLNEAYIQEVIKCCFQVGLLSRRMFEEHKIVTSKGIQERFSEISKQAKRKFKVEEFNLINSEEKNHNSEELPISSELLGKSPEEKPQRKVKERKVKESIVGAIAPAGEESPPLVTKSDYENLLKQLEEKDLITVIQSFKDFLSKKPPFPEPYMEYWNIAVKGCNVPQVKQVTDSRVKKLKVRLKEDGFDFVSIIKKVHESNKLKQESPWFSFDWIFENDQNYVKILEGNYGQ